MSTDLTALTVGPDQTLVLVSRHPLSVEQCERIKAQVPPGRHSGATWTRRTP